MLLDGTLLVSDSFCYSASFASSFQIFPHFINCSLERRFVFLNQRRYRYPARKFVYKFIVWHRRIIIDLFDHFQAFNRHSRVVNILFGCEQCFKGSLIRIVIDGFDVIDFLQIYTICSGLSTAAWNGVIVHNRHKALIARCARSFRKGKNPRS